jgi:hypothetical protein
VCFRQDGLQTVSQLTTRKQHSALAAQAFQADISAQANDLPLVPTTRMRLPQANDIIHL